MITSSQLMRRESRAEELLKAEPWDIVVLDEAHHARRRAVASDRMSVPTNCCRLMRDLKSHTQGLVLLTATPMQVNPIEVWDLLACSACPHSGMRRRFLASSTSWSNQILRQKHWTICPAVPVR